MKIMVINHEELTKHCSRATLLVHSRKIDPTKKNEIESQQEIFSSILSYSFEIARLLGELS